MLISRSKCFPTPAVAACATNRTELIFHPAQWVLGEFHLWPFTGWSLFAATSYHVSGKLEGMRTMLWARWVSSTYAPQLYRFWEHWHWLHTNLAGLISFWWSKWFCPHLLYGNYLIKQLTNVVVVLRNGIERSLLGRVRKKGELVHLFRFSRSFLFEKSSGDWIIFEMITSRD